MFDQMNAKKNDNLHFGEVELCYFWRKSKRTFLATGGGDRDLKNPFPRIDGLIFFLSLL